MASDIIVPTLVFSAFKLNLFTLVAPDTVSIHIFLKVKTFKRMHHTKSGNTRSSNSMAFNMLNISGNFVFLYTSHRLVSNKMHNKKQHLWLLVVPRYSYIF